MGPGRGGAQGVSRAGRFAVEWLLFALVYALFTGAMSGAEYAAAGAAGVLAAALRNFLTRRGVAFAPGLRDAARLAPRVLSSLPADVVKVGLAFTRLLVAGRKPASDFVEVPFDRSGPEPRVRTRRGLVVAAVSIAPNRYVADRLSEPDRLLVHRLVAAPMPEDNKWPV